MVEVRAIIRDDLISFASADLFYLGMIMEKYSFGELTMNFFDMDINEIVDIINFPIVDCVEKYLDKCYYRLQDKVGILFAALLTNDIEKIIRINQQVTDVNEELNMYFQSLKITQVALSMSISQNNNVLNGKITDLLSSLQDITTCFILNEETKYIEQVFKINSMTSAVALDFCYVINKNIKIKKCENCHKYFIPVNRSDEIYCDRIFRNGKTCKELGSEEKIKNDEFASAYRTAYKTQHRRIKYNKHIANYKEKHFIPWKNAAKEKLSYYRDNNDIEGFKKWLEDNKDLF